MRRRPRTGDLVCRAATRCGPSRARRPASRWRTCRRSPRSLARLSPIWDTVWQEGTLNWILQAGQYTYTPDHRPLLGPSDVSGLVLNAGYSGHGIMASGGGSRLVVDTMLGRVKPED